MKKVLCFGEILIRQQATGISFFGKDDNLLRIYPGGSEANVAVGLAQMGTPTAYFSAFPSNALSHEIMEKIQSLNVSTDKVPLLGDRIGSYILLSANGLSKGEVIYDRKYSAFSQLTSEDLDYEKLFNDVDWFHWTALTPGLNGSMAELMEEVLIEAKKRNIFISVDLNYRNKLWQYGKEPIEVMPALVAHCDVLMGNIWAANKMLGTSVDPSLNRNTSSETYFEQAQQSAREVFKSLPDIKHITYTFRFMDTPQHNLLYGTYHTPDTDHISTVFETYDMIDRIGSGDAFMAGYIHALRNDYTPQQIIDTATGAGYQKLFVEGDFGNGKY